MKNRTAVTLSTLFHVALLVYLVLPTRATYIPPKQYMSVNLNEIEIEEPKPVPPEPEPEPEQPKPKISDETIQMLKTRVVPTPKPTKRPTNTPTTRPSNTPTRVPTQVPTQPPTKKPTPVPTHTPKPSSTPTEKPTLTPTPVLEIVSFDYAFTPQPTPTGQASFDYGQLFPNAEGMSTEDKNSYGAKLSNHLQRYWRQPRVRAPESRDYTTTVTFVIDKKGNISSLKMLTASGWELMDQTVVDAVKAANPAPALPPTFPSDSVQVRVPFILQKK